MPWTEVVLFGRGQCGLSHQVKGLRKVPVERSVLNCPMLTPPTPRHGCSQQSPGRRPEALHPDMATVTVSTQQGPGNVPPGHTSPEGLLTAAERGAVGVMSFKVWPPERQRGVGTPRL